MARNQVSSTRIYQFVFGLLFLFVSYGAVRTMMYGSSQNAKQIAFLAIAFAVVMWLDTHYWLILPLCMALRITVPGVPFSSVELGCLAFIGIHLIRTCMHHDQLVPWNRILLSALPLFAWICLVWVLNPAGLNMIGSFGGMSTQSIGGRFYLKILFSFFALYSLSTVRLLESACKMLFRVILAGSALSIVLTFFNPAMLETISGSSENVGARYFLLSFSGLYFILWSRYSLEEILSSVRLLSMGFFVAFAVMVSGKRSSTASIALIPIYRAVLTRKNIGMTALIGVIAFLFLSIAVSMDGQIIDIPESAKRSLAMIYPKYRGKGREGLHDTFRAEVHEGAKQLVRAHPWMGRRGFRMDMDTSLWLYGAGFEGQYSGHVFSGNWHGAFYAYAADFGVPGLLFYLLFIWFGLRFIFLHVTRFPQGSYQSFCFLYYGMIFVHKALFMFTSGHSSLSTEEGFLHLGMLAAIANGLVHGDDNSLS